MNKQYLDILTWLRAVAAFFVVVSHVLRTVEVSYLESDGVSYFLPLNLIDLGGFGVTLFFALSGCTLYISNSEKINSINDILSFYIRRFFRIWPAFFVSLVVYLLFIEVFKVFYSSDNSFWIAQFLREYTYLDVLNYLTLTFNISGPSGLFISPYWSLPVEFQYYLMLPLVILIMKSMWLGSVYPILLGMFLYACYKFHLFSVDRSEVFQLGFVFFGGVVVAKYINVIKFRIPFMVSLVIFLTFTLFLGMIKNDFIVISSSIPFLSTKWNLFGVFSIISVALALLTSSYDKNNYITRVIHRYGTISYSIYLTHMLFLGLSSLIIIHTGVFLGSSKLLFVFVFTVSGSYYLSILSYKYIEVPCVDVGNNVASKFTNRSMVKVP